MKAAILVESLTGHTQHAGELIAGLLQQEGWGITGLDKVKAPDHAAIQAADMVLIGTWVHGLFIVGQGPFGLGNIQALPAMRGKKAAVFCTFALNPKKTLDTMTGAVEGRGAEVIGGLALNRSKLEQHSEEFVARLLDALANPAPASATESTSA
jgi:flavodoxin